MPKAKSEEGKTGEFDESSFIENMEELKAGVVELEDDQETGEDLGLENEPGAVDESATQVTTEPDEWAEARSMGWKPEEEYEGDPDKWVDAGEFIRRAPLFDRSRKQEREIKKLRERVELLIKHNKRIEKEQYEKALEKLKDMRKQAAEDGDAAAMLEIQESIDNMSSSAPDDDDEHLSTEKEDLATRMSEWKAENKWYSENETVAYAVDGYMNKFAKEHPDSSVEDLLSEAERFAKKSFPDVFGNRMRQISSRVSSTTRRPSLERKPTQQEEYQALPREAKIVYRTLVKTKYNPAGELSHEEYMKQYNSK